jgi:hypothetical protein
MILFLSHLLLSPRWNNQRLRTKATAKLVVSAVLLVVAIVLSLQQKKRHVDDGGEWWAALPLVLKASVTESFLDVLCFAWHLVATAPTTRRAA